MNASIKFEEKELAQFLFMAKGSIGELLNQLYVAFYQDCISEETFNHFSKAVDQIGRLTGGLMNNLGKPKSRGSSFT